MSTIYGVTETGFNVKRLEDIIAELEDDLRALFGDINTAPESVFGQHIGAFSKPLAEVWEKMESVYLSQYPQSAEGVSLDNAAQLNAIERLGPTRTLATAAVEGVQGTLIPTGTQFSTEDDNDLFESLEDIVIDKADVVETLITIEDGSAGDFTTLDYQITINSSNFNKVAGAGDDEVSIANDLKDAINAGSEAVTASVPTTPDGTITIIGDLDSQGKPTAFSVDVSRTGTPPNPPADPGILLSEIWTPIETRAIESGAILAVANTLTQIETPVAGLNSVNNLIDGTIGRGFETDAELRIRRKASLQIVGAATVDAIRARLLQEVEGVSEVAIFENRLDVADGNTRPGHSFECVVQGGVDQEIGQKIWDVKPAGIETTFGNSPSGVTVQITDSNGDLQDIKFSRPTSKYGWVRVVLTLYDASEEQFPIDGLSQVAANILELGESLNIGRDLTIQRWFGPVFEVPGIASAVIEHDLTDTSGGPPSYVDTNIPVDSTWLPLFDLSRIDVTAP